MLNREQTKPGRLIVVSGPSGVGKGTILRRLFQRSSLPLVLSVSATTRAKRPMERDGVEYHFLSREEFARRNEAGEFLEAFEVFAGGDWYGTLRRPVIDQLNEGKWVVLEIDVQGAKKVLQNCPEAITIFIEPPNIEALRKRLTGRGTESPEAFERRLNRAIDELDEAPSYRYRIVNDNLNRAVDELNRILKKTDKHSEENL